MHKIDEEALILSVRSRPFLYDRNDPKHNNRDVVRTAWDEVATEIDVDVEMAKRRWVQLRDYFNRILRTEKRSSTGELTFRRKKWALFEYMTFLVPHLRCHESTMNEIDDSSSFVEAEETKYSLSDDAPYQSAVSLNEEHSNESDSESNILPLNMTYQHRMKRKHSDFDTNTYKTMKRNEDTEENELFFKSLTPVIRKLTPLKAMEFRHEVHGLLLHYLREQEARTTTSNCEVYSEISTQDSKAAVPHNN